MIWRPVDSLLTVTVPSSATETSSFWKPPVYVMAVALTVGCSTLTVQPSSGLKLKLAPSVPV